MLTKLERSLALTTLIAFGALATGCDACAGVFGCGDAPHAAVQGRIVTGEEALAVRGATVTLGSAGRLATTVTDDNGVFVVSIDDALPDMPMSLRVEPIGFPGYEIDSLPCKPMIRAMDACILDPLVPAPWVPIHALITYRGTEGELVKNAAVRFDRTGGAEWFGPDASETFSTTTDANGVAFLFPIGVYVATFDTIIGNLTVTLPPPLGPSTRTGYIVRPVVGFADRPVDFFSVGPSLSYRLAFVDSASGTPVAGVTVTFNRSGGIPTAPAHAQAVSTPSGDAFLNLRALASGDLDGTLKIAVSNGSVVNTVDAFRLTTFDNDSTRLGGRWRIGRTGIAYPAPIP